MSALSEQFVFQLALMAEDAAIDLKDMMGKNVSVGIQLADGSEHFINAYVNAFGFTHADGGFAFYHAEIVPWLTYLKLRVNSRIFQDENVLGVLDKIYKGDYAGLASYEFRTSRTYPRESYIVQYQESDEHFTSRLMEKYGLFYYFEHSASGHLMVISDDSCNSGFCPPQAAHAQIAFNAGHRVQDADCVSAFAAQRVLQPTRVAMNTFDFKAPSSMQYVELPTIAQQGHVPSLEVYDGNPAYAYKSRSDGDQAARQRMEVLEWQAKVFMGASDCRGLTAGRTFKLNGHHWFDDAGGDNGFLVLSVQYHARNNYFEQGGQAVYMNTFSAIRRKIPYRPRRAHAPPRMPGPQTATVVGPKGMEIHTDKLGRIKVQFPWDRYGRHDERSSCWIRVAQPWAGQNWGTISVPRVGQEVIIDYLEGDPDRPLCTGRVYNSAQQVPYGLPAAAHMMGIKSRSTPGGGGYCEMVIHDQKGKELINIHSQKDMVTTVQNNQTTLVNGPHQTNTVTNGFHMATVKKSIDITSQTQHIHLTASTDITLGVGSSRIVMKADGTIQIHGVNVDIAGSSRIDLNRNIGLSPAGRVNLGEQKNGGVIVSPPSQQELNTAIKHQKPFDITESMHNTRALHEGKLQVLREGNMVILKGRFSVFSAAGPIAAEQLISDIDSRFKGLSYISDGLTYKTEFSFNVAKARTGSDIRVDYFELPDDRGQAQFNGQIFLDRSADLPYIRAGVGAHEFSHTVLGLPDGYHDITLKRPQGLYYVRGVPYKEQENSLMSDTSKRIPGPDLKKIILKIESDIKGKK